MSCDQQRLADYLAHIAQAIERIGGYTKGMDALVFMSTPLVQDPVIRNVEVIGEASNNIEKYYSELAAAHPELPLVYAYQMRNALAHGYFNIDLQIVWKTIQADLPQLHTLVSDIQLPK